MFNKKKRDKHGTKIRIDCSWRQIFDKFNILQMGTNSKKVVKRKNVNLFENSQKIVTICNINITICKMTIMTLT